MKCRSQKHFSLTKAISIVTYIWSLAIVFLLLPFNTIAQTDTTATDSSQIQKVLTERYLQRLVEEVTTNVQQSRNQLADLEIDEIIVNSMISKAGNDFLDYFTADFDWPETEQNFIIIITEKPFRASTTQLIIEVNELEVFQNVIQPRNAYLEELAKYAQVITTQYILNYDQIMNELEGADRSGSGIY